MTSGKWKTYCRVLLCLSAASAMGAVGAGCPRCGDGAVNQASEECDDGNTVSGDGCSATCQDEARCGDGTVDAGEECDDGNTTNGDGCSATCQDECGDGTCDAGAGENVANCPADCTPPIGCGDGIVNGTDECDDGGANSDTTPDACRTNCKNPSCGDAVTDTGETCDDGNTAPGDGCSATCQDECGDGICAANEHTADCPADCPTVLFIANFATKNVVSFEDPGVLNSSTSPENTNLTDPGLNGPSDVIVTADGSLIVSNFLAGSLTRYNDALTVTGPIPATATLTDTTAPVLNAPASLTVNVTQDLVLVANFLPPLAIRVYESASGLGGNVPAARRNTSASLAAPAGINFGAGDQLFVANGANVLRFDNASTRPTSAAAADAIITSASFTTVFDVFVDNADNLIVVNLPNQILIFEHASTLVSPPNAIPRFTLTRGTTLSAVVVGSDGKGYVVDRGAKQVLVWDDIATRSGNPDANRKFSSTHLTDPIRAFLLER